MKIIDDLQIKDNSIKILNDVLCSETPNPDTVERLKI